MSEPWPTIPLGELLKDEQVSYGIVQPGQHDPQGIPIVRVRDVRNGRVDTKSPLRVATHIEQNYSRTRLDGGELLISIVGTVGETAIATNDLIGWNVARAIAVLRPEKVDAAWLRIALSSPTVTSVILSSLNTTVQATLNLSDLKKVPIPVPPEQERKGITNLLRAFDRKVDANKRIASLTDQLLRIEFRKLMNTDRWTELATIASVNSLTVKPKPIGTLRYLDISAVREGGYEYPAQTSWTTAPGRARRGLRYGDTIWSTVRPNRRSHALVLDHDADLIASTGLAVLTPQARRTAGVYEASKTSQFLNYLESVAEGSAYPAVRADRFASAPVPDLTAAQWDHFEDVGLPLRRRSHAADSETRLLTAVRQELLVQLMTGKLRLRELGDAIDGQRS